MKRLLKLLVLILVIAGAGFGYLQWKKMQDEKAAESTPAAAPATTATAPNLAAPTPPAATPPAASTGAYDLTPQADELSKAVATLTMDNGSVIKFRFYTKDAPNTVKRITDLISQGFYNGIVVHRVEPGFVVQAGDPTGTGAGGSGVKLKAEFNNRKHEPGILSMARLPNDPDSADSQFFIMLGTVPQLDHQYTIFGKTVEGFDNVKTIKKGDKIKSFTIQ